MSSPQKLETLIQKLEAQGIDISEIAHLNAAITTARQPLHKRALNLLKSNWRRAKGELKESKELTILFKKLHKEGSTAITEAERIFIKQQLTDFFRIFPAGLIAGVNAALPIPGTSFITPWILKKMGLLPSRWREANMLKTLQESHQKLRKQGEENLAQELLSLESTLKQEATQREVCDLLVVWDANQNGIWDPEEEEAYQKECVKVRTIYTHSATARSWFLLHEGLVFGPTPIHNLTKEEHPDTLTRFAEQTQWVRLSDILPSPQS